MGWTWAGFFISRRRRFLSVRRDKNIVSEVETPTEAPAPGHPAPKAGVLLTALHPVIELLYPAGLILPKQARCQLCYTRGELLQSLRMYPSRATNCANPGC